MIVNVFAVKVMEEFAGVLSQKLFQVDFSQN